MKNEETQHTQEPWIIGANGKIYGNEIRFDEQPVCNPKTENTDGQDTANARRICAAVNACKGVPTEILEEMPRVWVSGMSKPELDIEFSRKMHKEIDRLSQQNAELVELLEPVVEDWDNEAEHAQIAGVQVVEDEWMKRARAALAKHDPEIINLTGMDDQQARAALSAAVPDAIEQMRRFFDEHDQPEAEKADQSKYVQPIAHRLTEATQNLVKFLRQQYPWEVSEPLNSILREAENALRDPQGLEPRGIVTVVTAADVVGLMQEMDRLYEAGQTSLNIRQFVEAAQFAMRLLSQSPDDPIAQRCVTQLALAINNVTPYGPGPMIQERPRPEEEA